MTRKGNEMNIDALVKEIGRLCGDPPSKVHWCPNPDIVAAIAREVLSGALTCQCGRLNPEKCLEDPCRHPAPRFASKKKSPGRSRGKFREERR